MPYVNKYSFGPGSKEMLRLDAWVSKVEPRDEGEPTKRVKVRLVGQYDVFPGEGYMFRVNIKIDDGVWSSEPGAWTRDVVKLVSTDDTDAHGRMQAAHRVADQLVEWALEELEQEVYA